MITPSPTTKIDPKLARGTLGSAHEATATKPAYLVLDLPNTSYQLHLQPVGGLASVQGVEPGKRLIGTIVARARRVDVPGTGGRYVEPVAGRPRRVQGRVIAVEQGRLVVDAGVPIHCELTDARQKPEQFPLGVIVSFDVLDGATFARA